MFDNVLLQSILKKKSQPAPSASLDFGSMTLNASHQFLFNIPDFEEGFSCNLNTTTTFESKDGFLNLYFNSDLDAYILSPEQLDIDGSNYNHVIIRLKFEPDTYAYNSFTLAWVLAEDEEFVYTSVVDTTGKEDGNFYEYDIDLSIDNNWTSNKVYQLMFVFDGRSDHNIYIDYIRVQNDGSSVATDSIQALQTDGSMPAIFRDHSDNIWAAWLKATTGGVAKSKTWTTDADFNTGTKSQVVVGSNTVTLAQYSATGLAGYAKRKLITIAAGAGAGTFYQVKLLIGENAGLGDFNLEGHSSSFPTGKNVGGDLAFTTSDKVSEIDFWVETVTGAAGSRIATVWVEVPASLSTSSVDIYCYYSNAAASNKSNGATTFLLFDDFDGVSIDGTKWTNGAGATVAGSILTITGGANGWIKSIATFSRKLYKSLTKLSAQSTAGWGFNKVVACSDDMAQFRPVNTTIFWIINQENATYTLENLGAPAIGVYYNDEVRWLAASIKWYRDAGQLGTTHTTNLPNEALPVIIMADGATNVLTDYVYVRNYVASEPAFSSASAEETVGNLYYLNGYDELIYDGGETVDWSTYDFSVDLLEPANTNVKIKCATSDDNISYSSWSGWFDTSTGTLTGVANSRYIKVQAYLETTNTAATPTLGALTINGLTTGAYAIKYKKYTGSTWGSETTLVTDATEYANNICLYENNANQMELVYALDSNVYRTYYNSGWQTPVSIVTHTSGDMRCWAFKGADTYDYIYYSYVSGGNYYIKYKSSIDNYAAENSVLISTSKIKNICAYEDDKNVVWLVYEQYDNYTSRPTFIHLYCKKSVDYGVNWGSATKISSTEETKENLWLCGLDKLMALDEEDNWETVINSASPYKGVNYKGKVYLVDSFKSRLDGVIASDSNKLYKFDGADWSTNHDFSADTPAEKAYDIIEAGDYLWILGAAYVSKYDGTTLTKLNTAVIDCANESYTFGEIGLCFGALPIYCGGGKVGANTGKYYKFIDYVGWAGQIGATANTISIMESYYYEDELYIVALIYEAIWGEYWGMQIYKFNNSTVAFPFDLIYDDDASTGYRYGGVSNYFVVSKMRFLNGVPYLLMVGGDSSGTVINSRIYNLIDYSVSESLVGATLNNFIRTIYDWKGEKYYISKQTTWKVFKYDETELDWIEQETAPCQAVDSIKVKVPLQHAYPRITQTVGGQILVYYQNNRNYYREPGKINGILLNRNNSLEVGIGKDVSLLNRRINLGFDIDDWSDTEKVAIFSIYNSVTDKYDVFYEKITKITLGDTWASHQKINKQIKKVSIKMTDQFEAGTFDIELDNSDNNFSPDNVDSNVYGYLEENKDLRLSLGFLNNLQLLMTGLIDDVTCDYSAEGEKVTRITGKDYWKKLLDVPVTLAVGEDKTYGGDVNILIKHISGNTATAGGVAIPFDTFYQFKIPIEFVIPYTDTDTDYEIKLENLIPTAGWSFSFDNLKDAINPGAFVDVKIITVGYAAWTANFSLQGVSKTDSSIKRLGDYQTVSTDTNVTLIETGTTNGGGWNSGITYYIWNVSIQIPSKEIDDDYDLSIIEDSHSLPTHTPEFLDFTAVYPEYIEQNRVHNYFIRSYIYIFRPDTTDFDFSCDIRYTSKYKSIVSVRPTKEELFYKLCSEVGISDSEFREPIREVLPKTSFIEEQGSSCFEKLRQVCWDIKNKLYKLFFDNYGKLIFKPIFEDYTWYSKLWTTSTDWLTHSAIDDVTIYDGSIELTLSGTPMGDVGFYYPPDIPEDEGWTKVLSGTATRTITDVYYETSGGNSNYLFYYADPSLVSANGWVFEFKAKIDANPQNDYWSDTNPWGTFIAYGQDNSKSCALSLVNGQKTGSPRINRIVLHSDNYGSPSILGTIYATYDCDVTVYATYKVFVLNNLAWVYRNGVEVMTAISLTANDNHYAHKFLWGDVTSHVSKSNKEWLTYIKYQAATSGEWKYEGDGYIRLQKDAGEEVHWENYLTTQSTPTGTKIKLRFKTAMLQTDLTSADWSNWYGEISDNLDIPDNQWIEAEIYLETSDAAITPTMDDLAINYRDLTIQRNMVWTFTEDQDIVEVSKTRKDIDIVTRVKVTGCEEEIREVTYPETKVYDQADLEVPAWHNTQSYTLYFSNANGSIKVDPASIRVVETWSNGAGSLEINERNENYVKLTVRDAGGISNHAHRKVDIYAKPIGEAIPTAIYKVETDDAGRRLYGLKQEDIENPLVATEGEAQNLCLVVLAESKLEREPIEFETVAGLLIEPGDFITIKHQDSNTNTCYKVKTVEHTLDVSEEGNKLTTKLSTVKVL